MTVRSRAALVSGLAVGALLARSRQLRWGATGEEVGAHLPGDDLVPDACLAATRAITIPTPPERVWPWIVQLGQGRGGFYSYDLLENLVGCDIHSAAVIVPGWQHLEVGDSVRLHPTLGLEVAAIDPPRSLVLRGAAVEGDRAMPYDFTWAFVLRTTAAGTTRLIVRERYRYRAWWAPLMAEPVEAVSFVMTQKMLRGIRDRAVAAASSAPPVPDAPGVYLFWIPVGAGKHVVRISCGIYEALVALVQRRRRQPLFHSALVVVAPDGRYVVEMTEIRDDRGAQRGVVKEGPVGLRAAGRFRLFRYEIRRWREGTIPDVAYAVAGPLTVADGAGPARRVLELVPDVPTLVWGRDELRTGEMWNSNSDTSWLLTAAGLDAGAPPAGGRAPGWDAGVALARRPLLGRPGPGRDDGLAA